MDSSHIKREISRKRRVMRVRKGLKGNKQRLRLSIFKSNKHLYAQLIDDEDGKTLIGVSTLSKKCKSAGISEKSKEAARFLGEQIAEMAKEKNIDKILFDRGRFKYHGIIAELAEGARSKGLQF
jgi:large subunit ribosomal protein L18